ncbi:PREDICTED: uncharacterized protein LOC105460389 [Wasmannia auropunctata]|uniref:uncharacterized protein LOC105460389 n=1 Tax=Wasmannia auropunctata TaxID=64793 RepID=UPI0005EDD103|nr:PREDICTED: uncharacterized protein LOC105460389 [Wasmannia auropunctata]
MNHLNESYHAFEDYIDVIAALDPNEIRQTEFANIQELYNALIGVENTLHPSNVSEASTSASIDETHTDDIGSATLIKKQLIELPKASLPTFDGKYENWLSFKNAFYSMIGSQTDLSDADKLNYLKLALTGEAASKIRIFAMKNLNYTKAWELLERAYEARYDVKRILISRHLSLLLNLPTLVEESTSDLFKLADAAQQHVASLNTLGFSINPEMVITILENKLPKSVLERWETTIKKDEFPPLSQMYKFLYKSAVCASKLEIMKTTETERDKGEPECIEIE